MAVTLIVVIILLVAVFIAYINFQNVSIPKGELQTGGVTATTSISNVKLPASNIATATSTSPTSSNSLLKTYVDEESGFSFQYPADTSDHKYATGLIGLPFVETGTNLDGKSLKVVTFAGNNCQDFYSKVDDEPNPPVSGERNGWYIQEGGDAAMGHSYRKITYSKPIGPNRGCVTLELILSSVNDLQIPVYTGGVAFKPYDEKVEAMYVMDKISDSFKVVDLNPATAPSVMITFPANDLSVKQNAGFVVNWVSKNIKPVATEADTSYVQVVLRSADGNTTCALPKVATLTGQYAVSVSDLSESCLTNGRFGGLSAGTYEIDLSGYTSPQAPSPDLWSVANGYLTVISR